MTAVDPGVDAAADSGARLRLILKTATDAIVEADSRGRVIEWNDAAERMFGWSRDEILGLSLAVTIIPERFREGHVRGMRNHAETGEGTVLGKTVELAGLHRSGLEFPLELSISPTRSSDGRTSFIAFIRDITERRHLEQTRIKAEQARQTDNVMLRGVIENTIALVYIKDLDGRYRFYNGQFAEAFDLDARGAAEGRPGSEVLVGRDDLWLGADRSNGWRENDTRALAGPHTSEEWSDHPSKGRVHYDATTFPLKDSAGVTYATCGMLLDVTLRRRTAEELRHQSASLEQSNHELAEAHGDIKRRALDLAQLAQRLSESQRSAFRYLEDMAIGVFVVDVSGTPLFANRAALGLLGKGIGLDSQESSLAETFSAYVVGTNDLYPAERMPILRALKGEVSIVDDMEVRTPQGLRRRLEVRGAPILGPDQSVRSAIATFTDVSETHRQQAELRRYASELEFSNKELEQFAYVASHDLQEPLRMVASYVELLARQYGDKLGEDAKEYIGFAVDGATRMQQLIADLLSYSRVGREGRPLAPTDLQEVLSKALANLGPTIAERGAQVSADVLPSVTGDPGQLVQLFQNLIANAIKFTAGGVPVVRVAVEPCGEMWQFSVQDNGIGIDPAHGDQIFDMFQRLHGRGEYPGTGIGLAICRRIVARHEGRIWVDSEVGHGSSFRFTLQALPGLGWAA